MTWKDVDLKDEIIYVNHQLYYQCIKGEYKFGIGEPKTESGKRAIPLTANVVTLMKELKKKELLSNGHSDICIDGCSGFVFLNMRENNVIIPRQFSDSLSAACRKYNKMETDKASQEGRKSRLLPMITSHVLRHTGCTWMAECGIDIKVLQTIMGHKKVDLTMNIYNHTDLQRMKTEFARIETNNGLIVHV